MDINGPSPANLAERVAEAPRHRGRIRFLDDQLPVWFRDRGRDEYGGQILPRRCGLYSAGHEVHWIQATRSAGTMDDEETRCRLVGVEGELLIVKARDRYRAYWNHEMERLVEEVGGLGRYVYVSEEWSLLSGGGTVFSVLPAHCEDWRPCPSEPLPPVIGPVDTEDLVELMHERGGFSIPFAQIRLDAGGDSA